ncbi:hypothetical protein CLOSTMETH_01138 [[Clostridium] methylpentosum DSM 5476]|uniref:Uncharacterized protein n=1 Tax=[Clostridium] methylpentosum DSM 5476 TaxID=537013 RepID=C0EBC0_9FIRM|nr:hypothetical protein CLOSTMETH_01138 [[Clostridium] methylpentosum DSM 5476]
MLRLKKSSPFFKQNDYFLPGMAKLSLAATTASATKIFMGVRTRCP